MAKRTYTETVTLKPTPQWTNTDTSGQYQTYFYDFNITKILNNSEYPNAQLVDIKYTISLDHGSLRYTLETETGKPLIQQIEGYSDKNVSLQNEAISAAQGNGTMQEMMTWMKKLGSTQKSGKQGRFRIHWIGSGQYELGPIAVSFVYEYGTNYTVTNFGVSNSDIGKSSTLRLTNNNSLSEAQSYKLTATWKFGNNSETSTVQNEFPSTLSYTIPASWANNLNSTATSGTCTVTLTTVADGETIGTTTRTFTLTLPADVGRPEFNNLTATSNRNNEPNVYVQNKNTCTLKAQTSGKYGATIKKWTISGAYSGTVNSATFNKSVGTVTKSGRLTYRVTCTDSRGFTSTAQTVQITVVANALPTLTSGSVVRINDAYQQDDEGTKCRLSVKGTYSPVTIRNQDTNSISSIKWYAKLQSESDDSYAPASGVNITNSAEIEDGKFTITNLTLTSSQISSFDNTKNYNIKLVVTDTLNGNNIVSVLTLGSTSYTIHLKKGGNGVAFGKIAETDKMVEINKGWKLKSGAIIVGDIPSGLSLTINAPPQGSGSTSRNICFQYPSGDVPNGSLRYDYADKRFQLLQYKNAGSNYDRYNLPVTTESESTNGTYDILTTKSPVTIQQGGTGGTDVATALRSLGLAYAPGTYSIANLGVSGFVTGSSKNMYLYFNFPQWFYGYGSANITVSELTGVVRTSAGGYVNSASSAINWVTESGISTTVSKITQTQLRVLLANSDEYSNVTNNTPVFYTGSITFTIAT